MYESEMPEGRALVALDLQKRLLGVSPVRRAELAGSEEYRNLDLAKLLLRQAEAAQPEDLPRSDELARLAFVIAEPVVDERRASRANEVKARACVLAGNVLRLRRQQEDAESMFRKAVFHLTGPPDCEERAFYCWNLARLRAEQGQLDEAVGLLWRAALLYRDSGDRRREGLCQAELGFLHVEEDQAGRAVPPLTQACQSLELETDPVPYIRSAVALAWCHSFLGDAGRGRGFLEAARSRGEFPEGEARAVGAWFEGRIAALQGAPEEAVRLLEEGRRELVRVGEIFAAARAARPAVGEMNELPEP